MAKTDVEKQRDRRARMYAAGYKQKNIWVPVNSEKEDANMEREAFTLRVTALTAGWPKRKISKLLKEVLEVMKLKIKEGEE